MTDNPHPLDPATAAEYLAGREIMAAAGLLADPVRFAYYGLEEPAKDAVLSGSASSHRPVDRRLRAFLLNLKNGESADVVVSLTRGAVVSARTVDTAAEGQLPIIDSEYHLVEEIVAADPDRRAALARRRPPVLDRGGARARCPGAPAPVQRAARHVSGRAGERGGGGRRHRPADRAGQPVRTS